MLKDDGSISEIDAVIDEDFTAATLITINNQNLINDNLKIKPKSD